MQSIKTQVLERDNYQCIYCGLQSRFALTIDHVIPKSKGGPRTMRNLVAACRKCNGTKSDHPLESLETRMKEGKE